MISIPNTLALYPGLAVYVTRDRVTFPWRWQQGKGHGLDADVEIDAIGLLCPLPVLKARKRLMTMEVGQVLRILADDPAAMIDMPHFCHEAGHSLERTDQVDGAIAFHIRKGPDQPG